MGSATHRNFFIEASVCELSLVVSREYCLQRRTRL
jgi:hypothetical protein